MLKSGMLRACACVLAWTMFAVAELPAATTEGLTLKRFSNTALAGAGVSTTVLRSVESIKDCEGDMGQSLNCGAPSSFLLTGRLQPAKPGKKLQHARTHARICTMCHVALRLPSYPPIRVTFIVQII